MIDPREYRIRQFFGSFTKDKVKTAVRTFTSKAIPLLKFGTLIFDKVPTREDPWQTIAAKSLALMDAAVVSWLSTTSRRILAKPS